MVMMLRLMLSSLYLAAAVVTSLVRNRYMGKLEANHWASRVAEQTAVELRQMVEGMRGPECLLLPLPIFTFIPTLPFEPRLDSDPPSSFLKCPMHWKQRPAPPHLGCSHSVNPCSERVYFPLMLLF